MTTALPARRAVAVARARTETGQRPPARTVGKRLARAASFPAGDDRSPAFPNGVAPQRGAERPTQGTSADGRARPRSVPSADGQSVITGPIVMVLERSGSLDDDLRALSVQKPRRALKERPEPRMPARRRAQLSTGADRLTQAFDGGPNMATPLIDFAGMDFNTWGAGWPPDPNGDVGPNHYIQTVNTSIEIFYKNGTRATGSNPITFDSFFASGGAPEPCASNNNGDPIVLYDRVSGRWIITDFAWVGSTGPYYECIAVSKSADPVSGGWWFYAFQTHASYMADYPKLGVWPDGIYMSANLFDSSSQLHGAALWAFNRDDLISGGSLHAVVFNLSNDAGLLPANYSGALPPAGAPNIFADLEPTVIHLWRFHVDWANTASSTFSGPVSVPIGPYTMPVSIPQPVSQTLDPLSDRLMMQAQYRRIGGTESLWLNHTITGATGAAGIRWYEVRNPNGTPSLYQQSTFQPDSTHRWMGSLAVDGYGNMALGYSVSSSSVYPSIRYTGRAAGDAPNTLQSEVSVIAGAGAETRHNRWGDYSAMSVDPVDDCTFWYTTEYFQLSSSLDNWLTRIASFRFPGCGSPPTLTDVSPATGPTAGGTTVTLTGTNFVAGATTVSVGGNSATNILVNSTTSLTATTPAGAAGSADVRVTTAAGYVPLVAAFTYSSAGTAPTLTGVTPASGPTTGGTTITLTGTNFVAGATSVTVGGSAAAGVSVASTTSLTAMTPAGVAGPANVAVTTADGSASLAAAFTYTSATGSPPTLTSVLPSSGPTAGGTTITVTGTSFVIGGTTVTVGGNNATGVNAASDTSLTAVTPAGAAGAATIAVATGYGSGSLAGAFTYTSGSGSLPTLSDVSPSSGPTTGGATITLTGTHFVPGQTAVTVGGIPVRSLTVTSTTSMTAVTPVCAKVDGDPDTVPVTIATSAGAATLMSAFTCTPPPTIVAVEPAMGSVLGGTMITLTGTRFVAGGTVVIIGGIPATDVIVTSPTSMTAVTPAAAARVNGPTDLTVTTAGGTATRAGGFTYTQPPEVTLVPVVATGVAWFATAPAFTSSPPSADPPSGVAAFSRSTLGTATGGLGRGNVLHLGSS